MLSRTNTVQLQQRGSSLGSACRYSNEGPAAAEAHIMQLLGPEALPGAVQLLQCRVVSSFSNMVSTLSRAQPMHPAFVAVAEPSNFSGQMSASNCSQSQAWAVGDGDHCCWEEPGMPASAVDQVLFVVVTF